MKKHGGRGHQLRIMQPECGKVADYWVLMRSLGVSLGEVGFVLQKQGLQVADSCSAVPD